MGNIPEEDPAEPADFGDYYEQDVNVSLPQIS